MVRARIWFEDAGVTIEYEDLEIYGVTTIVDRVNICFSRRGLRKGVTISLSLEEAKELLAKLSEKTTYLEKALKR